MEAMTARRYKSSHERIGRFKVWRTGAHVPKADARVFTSEGSSLPLTEEVLVGSSPECHLRISGANVGEQHARLYPKNGRIFCRALVGDAEAGLHADTFTWLVPGTQLRAGVDYLLAPGAQLAFGDEGANVATVEFEVADGGGGGAMGMLMDAMLAGASDEVKAHGAEGTAQS